MRCLAVPCANRGICEWACRVADLSPVPLVTCHFNETIYYGLCKLVPTLPCLDRKRSEVMSRQDARRQSPRFDSVDRRDFIGACGLSALALAPALTQLSSAETRWAPAESPNQPVGEAKGIFPGRVVWVHDPTVAKWDGDTTSGSWWEDKFTDPAMAEAMLKSTLQLLTGGKSDQETWGALFRHYNQSHGRGNVGYRPGEKVAIKVNMNCSRKQDRPFFGLYNTPQLTQALLRQLVTQAGVQESDIVVCDASRWINDTIFMPCRAEFPNVRFEDRDGTDGRCKALPDKNVALNFGDPNTPNSGETYLPASITGATYVINAASMKGHSLAAVTLCAKNHFGSVYRENIGPRDPHKGWNPSHLHNELTVRTRPMGTYNVLVDFMGHKDLGGKTILYLVDAIYAAEHQNGAPVKWQSSPFDGHWTASIFASQDPVAIESVGVDFFAAEKSAVQMVGAADNYLHEAALAHKPPSQIQYAPDGDAKNLASLGVHEHWNSPAKKQYSRNLGTGQGIELVKNA